MEVEGLNEALELKRTISLVVVEEEEEAKGVF
jgi:hypothetical protein